MYFLGRIFIVLAFVFAALWIYAIAVLHRDSLFFGDIEINCAAAAFLFMGLAAVIRTVWITAAIAVFGLVYILVRKLFRKS